MTFTTCIFDLDGVITDTAHYHFLAWQALAHKLGIDFTAKHNDALKGVGRMESLELILARSALSLSLEEKQALAYEKNEHYKSLIAGVSPADLLPGVLETLQWLKQKNWKIGLASASRNAQQVIAGLGIADVFDYAADAGAIPNGKPAPDIFLDVAKALKVPSQACIGIEDAAAGVAAIKSAGMYAIGIGEKSLLAEADIVLPATDELKACLISIG